MLLIYIHTVQSSRRLCIKTHRSFFYCFLRNYQL